MKIRYGSDTTFAPISTSNKARAVVLLGEAAAVGRRGLRLARRRPLGTAGLALVFVTGILALLAPWISPYDPNAVHADFLLRSPGWDFLLGTDQLGRDVLSRLLYGARTSFVVGLSATALGCIIGGLAGLVGGYYGGLLDNITQRLADLLLAFPTVVVGITIMVALGPSLLNVIITISVPIAPIIARVVRASVLTIKTQPYIDAAKSMGAADRRILFCHVAPGCLSVCIVMGTALFGTAILFEAMLSFLGMGVPPPHASWGRMLSSEAAAYFEVAPWMPLTAGIAITQFVFGISVFGDALRDILDPQLRASAEYSKQL